MKVLVEGNIELVTKLGYKLSYSTNCSRATFELTLEEADTVIPYLVRFGVRVERVGVFVHRIRTEHLPVSLQDELVHRILGDFVMLYADDLEGYALVCNYIDHLETVE